MQISLCFPAIIFLSSLLDDSESKTRVDGETEYPIVDYGEVGDHYDIRITRISRNRQNPIALRLI